MTTDKTHPFKTLRELAEEMPHIMEPIWAEYQSALADQDPKIARRMNELGYFLFGEAWVKLRNG